MKKALFLSLLFLSNQQSVVLVPSCPPENVFVGISKNKSKADVLVPNVQAIYSDESIPQNLIYTKSLGDYVQLEVGIHRSTILIQDEDRGKGAECNYSIHVSDSIRPVFEYCPNEVQLFAEGPNSTVQAVYTYSLVDNVNAYSQVMAESVKVGDELAIGRHLVSIRGYDSSGNQAFCFFNIYVNDGSLIHVPGISKSHSYSWRMTRSGAVLGDRIIIPDCPQNANIPIPTSHRKTTASITVPDYPAIYYESSASLFAPRYVKSIEDGTELGLGTHQIKIEVYDKDLPENRASCEYAVTVVDFENPIFTRCPRDIHMFIPKGEFSVPAEYDWIVDDNVAAVVNLLPGSPKQNEPLHAGRHHVHLVARDQANNYEHCEFYINVSF